MKKGTQKNRKKSNQTKRNIQNDFYGTINHSWLKHYKIPPDETSVNLFNLLQKKINKQLLELIKKCEKNPKNNQEKNLVILYKSCDSYNSSLTNQQLFYFLQTLFDYLKRKDLYEFLEWLTYSGFDYPLNISVNHYIYNSQENILNIYPGEFSFNNKKIYLKNELLYNHYRREYIVFLRILFQYIFGSNHEYKVENILKIETEMAKYLYNSTENNDLEKKNNFYSLSEMKNHFSLDFQKICLFLGISNYKKKIQVDNPDYLKKISSLLLSHWNSKEWEPYWIFQILKIYSFLDKKTNHLFFLFYENVLKNKKKENPLSFRCLKDLYLSPMNTFLNQLYLKTFINQKEIEYCEKMAEKMKNAFEERLRKNTWLEKKTIEKALLKLKKMKFVIGYKEKWENTFSFQKIIYSEKDKYFNYKKNIELSICKLRKALDEKNNFEEWKSEGMNLFDVNAFYIGSVNEIIIPNAILQSPFLNLHKSFEYNLAFIGTTIGHELIHAFDDEGSKLDEKGNYYNWWTKKDKEEYLKKQKEVIRKYEKMASQDKIKLDGKLSLGENIADMFGLLLCEDVLEKYLLEKKIFGEKQDPYFKRFFTYYSISWKNKMNYKYLKNRLLNDVHSLSKYRVNGVLSNSPRFQKVFEMNKSNSMFNDDFIDIW